MSDLDFDGCADTGEQEAYAAGQAEAARELANSESAAALECKADAKAASETGRRRGLQLGSVLGLLDAAITILPNDGLTSARDRTAALIDTCSQLTVDPNSPDAVMADLGPLDEAIRQHLRWTLARWDSAAKSDVRLSDLKRTSAFDVAGFEAATERPAATLEW